jgi:MSHA biogenesis protein MshO
MRRIRPEPIVGRHAGFTLIEMIVAMVAVAIIVGATVFFAYPLQQAVDTKARAELTDAADNALQRIARDVRLALPNSVRVTNTANQVLIEFLAIRAAGRYRADSGGASSGVDCPADGLSPPGADRLSFDAADDCFKSLGVVADAASIAPNSDWLVLNNYGALAGQFPGQNAYEAPGGNRVLITGRTVEGARTRIAFTSTSFQRSLHDSPAKRFYVISGPVTYECNLATQELRRYSGYAITPAQPTGLVGGALLAIGVTGCSMDYAASGVAPQIGLLTIRLSLSRTLSGGKVETVSLYHAIHVKNVP